MKSDSEIERDVKDELQWDPDLDATDIAVTVKKGVVTLAGFVKSYTDKYEDDAVQLLTPAPLPPAQADEVRGLAVRAFEACRGESMARVDFFLTDDRGFLVNEVNTIPGFTPVSMYPRLWAETGVAYPELIDRLNGHEPHTN